MRDQIRNFANTVSDAASSAVRKASDLLQAHKPSDEQVANALTEAKRVGGKLVDNSAEMATEVSQTKIFRDAAKGAGLGAVAGVPPYRRANQWRFNRSGNGCLLGPEVWTSGAAN